MRNYKEFKRLYALYQQYVKSGKDRRDYNKGIDSSLGMFFLKNSHDYYDTLTDKGIEMLMNVNYWDTYKNEN